MAIQEVQVLRDHDTIISISDFDDLGIRGPVTVSELARVHNVVTQRGQPTSEPNR